MRRFCGYVPPGKKKANLNQTATGELPDSVTVAPAEVGDANAVLTLLTEADEWIRQRGIDPGVPPMPLRDIIVDCIRLGTCYLARREGRTGEIVGTITLEWADDTKEFVAGSIRVTIPVRSSWTQHCGDLLLEAVGRREAVVDGMHMVLRIQNDRGRHGEHMVALGEVR
jgi:hypothetical protein